MKYILSAFAALVVLPVILSCQSGSVKDPYDQIKKDNEAFLRGDKKGSETFRVLLSSDEYRVVQLKSQATIERAADDGGDKYMQQEMGKYDIFDEVRTGLVTVWLFPDSGAINKIRSQQPTNLSEIDSLINDDLLRWSFKFPKKIVEPTRFDVVYRVVLRKKLSDDQILDSVQQRMKEGQ